MNTFRFWMVFTVGVAAGAAVALIYAPQTGARTRKQLKRKLNATGDTLKDQVEDASDYIKDHASTLGSQAGKAYKKSRETVADASEDLLDNLQATVKKVKESVA